MKLPTVDQADLKGKRVFVRGDIDVPLDQGRIKDETRLQAVWPTIDYLLKQDCSVVVGGHMGWPGGRTDLGLSTRPVAEWMALQESRRVGKQESEEVAGVCLKGNICGFVVTEKLVVLENLRFDPREETDDVGFATELASLAEVYVNESFAESHREVASIVGLPVLLPHYAGLRLVKEVEVLSGVLENPKRPLVVVVGGAKLDTKLPVINKMAKFADRVIVGGKLLAETKERISEVLYLELTLDGKDSTAESVDQCQIIFSYAGTIVWNGPLGIFEDYTNQVGTRWIAELIARSKAYKVVGGGDTVEFLNRSGLISDFDFVSTGGGAMLAFLADGTLPGIEVLTS